MKQLLYLVISLIVIAAIIPATSAFEWHTGTWTSTGDDPLFPVSNLALFPDGGTWKSKDTDTGYPCYNMGNSSMNLTYITIGSVTQCNNIANDFVANTGPACGNGVHYASYVYGDKTNVEISMPFGPGHQYITFYAHGGCKRSYTDIKFYFDEIPEKDFDFHGTPLSGSAPTAVNFTLLNQTAESAFSWSFGDGNITASSATSIIHTYQNQGTYTVILNYNNNSGIANTIQKNNYITVGAPNATKTKWFQTIDGTNGNIVLNSSIQLNDIENSSWVNATGLINDGMSSITTLEGHTINAYAQSLGYSDADDLGILNDGQPQYIMMWPTFAENVSEGNVSLYVTVKDKDTKANIVGAGVIASLASGSMGTTTNEAGIAYFIVKNSSMVLITAQAIGQGYHAATTTINTGTASGGSASAAATILLGKNTVTPTFTTAVTTLPGGGTPTPVVTILPGCEDTISAAGQEKCRAAQSNQGLSFLSSNLLGLIQICFVVTILYLLGIKLGK